MKHAMVLAALLASACGNGSNGPLVFPDAQGDASTCAKNPCTIAPQSGCASGQACDIDYNAPAACGTTHCRVANSCRTEEADCNTYACAAGYTCWGNPMAYACHKFCTSSADCTGPGGQCIAVTEYGTAVSGVSFCTFNCDPTSTRPSCPATRGYCDINFNQTKTMIYTDCLVAGTLTQGGTCKYDNDCTPGLVCFYSNSANPTGVCEPWCVVGGPSTCPTGTTCMEFGTKLTVGTTDYGHCG